MNFVKVAEGLYINLDQVAEIRQDGEKYKLIFANADFPVVIGSSEFEQLKTRIPECT